MVWNGFYYLMVPNALYLTTVGFITLIAAVIGISLAMTISVFGTGLDSATVLKAASMVMIIGILFSINFDIYGYNWQFGIGLISNLLAGLGSFEGFGVFAWIVGALISVAAMGTGIITVMQNG